MTHTNTKPKSKITIYVTDEVLEALREKVYKSGRGAKNSHIIEAALREFLGLKNN